MVFVRYFLGRFIIAFFALAFVFALLLNVIEFFEKIVRVSHTTIGTITHFIILNFLPTFSHVMPLASWLATCLVIREFYTQNEWESLLLLNITYNVLFKLFIIAGFSVTFGALLFKEYLTIPLSSKAEQLRSNAFKKEIPTLITKTWYKLSDSSLCFIEFLDLHSKRGEKIVIINLNQDGNVHTITTAPYFDLHPTTKHLLMPKKIMHDTATEISYTHKDEKLFIPELFLELSLRSEPLSLKSIFQKLFFNKNSFSSHAYTMVAYAFFEQLTFYLQIFLFPVIIFVLFSIFINFNYFRWIICLLIYPLFTALSGVVFFLHNKYLSNWIFLIPLVAMGFIITSGILIHKQQERA